MIVTVFRSRLRPGFRDEYVALANRMNEIAMTMPGYISHASGSPSSSSSTRRACARGG